MRTTIRSACLLLLRVATRRKREREKEQASWALFFVVVSVKAVQLGSFSRLSDGNALAARVWVGIYSLTGQNLKGFLSFESQTAVPLKDQETKQQQQKKMK